MPFAFCCAAYTAYLAKHDPALLKRRTEAGISHEKEFTQKVVIAWLYAAFLLLLVVPPLDVRFGWSLMPWQACIAGDALGSWWTLLMLPLFIAMLVVRILNEESVLARDLSGYLDYVHEVRYRLVPGVW